jgi:proteasome accessory factor A
VNLFRVWAFPSKMPFPFTGEMLPCRANQMALRERIHSLETEYAMSFYPERGKAPGPGAIVDVLMTMAAESHGIEDSEYLVNGSKLGHDVGHAEWSLPECRSARELAAFDKAADRLFSDSIVPRAEKQFQREGFSGRLVVAKNNVDSFGHTYGCHENFQMLRDADLLTESDFVRYIAQSLVPFLVSRQILAGSGRLVTESRLRHETLRYEISQRSDFIETVVSRDTTRARPIFNLGREGESFSSGNIRRLHLILGDANVSGWATWIKMGTTGLMLRLVEDLFVSRAPILQAPVAALKTICRDLTGRAKVPLRGGGQITALDIQWAYYDLADKYLNIFGASAEDEILMEEWGRALEDYERDPMLLRDRADWAIKKHMIDTYLQQKGFALENMVSDKDLLTDLQAFDLRYHELSAEGLFCRMFQPDTLLTAAEIYRAQENPPPYTRARIRGETIRLGRDCGLDVRADRWTEVVIEDQVISIADPLAFDHPALAKWDRLWVPLQKLNPLATSEAEYHYKLGRCFQAGGRYQPALVALRTAVEFDAKEIRFVQALARLSLLMGHYDDAAEWFERYNQLVEADPDMTPDFNSLGDVYRLQGDKTRALQLYKKAIRSRAPQAMLAFRNMGLVHLKHREIEAAQAQFQQSLSQTVERLTSLIALGAIHLSRGERESGRASLEQALALPAVQASYGLTPEARAYWTALVYFGLEAPDGLEHLQTALEHQGPVAADGIYALEALVDLLAQASPALRNLATVQSLVPRMALAAIQPDSADLTPVQARSLDWLRGALAHPNVDVRLAAMTYVGWRADQENQEILTALLPVVIAQAHDDPEAQVRRAAVQVLGKPGWPSAGMMDELFKSLRDPSPAVCWAAQTSLENLTRFRTQPPGINGEDDSAREWENAANGPFDLREIDIPF